MLAVLRRRDFFLLWLSGLVSVAGDWVLMIALPYYVYVTTGSTLATAGMTAAELAPAILLSSFTGVFADRWDRKRILVVANLLQALVVASLLLVGEGWLWVVYVVAALQSTTSAFSMPAESALLPTLVPREQLVQANAMNALNNRLGRLVGVPLGAALLGWFGLDAVVLVDAATFLVAAALVAPIVVPAGAEPADGVAEVPHVLAGVAGGPAGGPRRPDDRGALPGVRADDVRRDDDRPALRAVDPRRARGGRGVVAVLSMTHRWRGSSVPCSSDGTAAGSPRGC